MSTSRSFHHVAGWAFCVLAVVCLGSTVLLALEQTRAHGDPSLPLTPNARAAWQQSAIFSLAVALAVLVVVLLPLQRFGRTLAGTRGLARFWAIGACVMLWAGIGLRLNRYTYGKLWRTVEEIGVLKIPAAVLEPRIWYSNVGLTIGCAVLAIALMALFERLLPGIRAPRAPRGLTFVCGLLLLLLVPLASVPPTAGFPAPPAGDVILISLDALRADRLGVYGNARGLTPHLDRLAADSVRFDRAYCQEPWTLTSHMSMLTGLYPDVHGLNFGRSLAPSVRTLPERLRDAGYRTMGSVYDCYLLNPHFGYGSGFSRYEVNGRRAGDRAARAAHDLTRSQRPVFLFLHFYDPHSDTGRLPYVAAPEFVERFAPGAAEAFAGWSGPGGASESLHEVNIGARRISEAQRAALADLYDAGVAETDAAVGSFLDRLRTEGRYDDALIIVTADHGEALGEADHFMHEKLIEETVRIPLLVKLPRNRFGGTVRTDLVETVDFMPTVLAQLALGAEAVGQGRDLFAGGPPRTFAFHRSGPDYAITTEDGWRIHYRFGEPNGVEVRALHRAGEEPGDGPDRLAGEVAVLDSWVAVLADLHRANATLAASFRGGAVGMTKADEELLRSLGYIE